MIGSAYRIGEEGDVGMNNKQLSRQERERERERVQDKKKRRGREDKVYIDCLI